MEPLPGLLKMFQAAMYRLSLTDLKPETIYDWRLMTRCGADVSFGRPATFQNGRTAGRHGKPLQRESRFIRILRMEFQAIISNPGNENMQIEIYDLTGMLVKKLEPLNESVVA
jgi:hypothetical protein